MDKIYFLILKFADILIFNDVNMALFASFSVLIILSFIITMIAFKNRKFLFRTIALFAFISIIPALTFTYGNTIGRPRPINLIYWQQTFGDEDPKVIYDYMSEEKGIIYLLLKTDGKSEPIYISLPWNERLAKMLHKAMKSVENNNGIVKMRSPFEHSYDELEQLFYVPPVSPLPNKQKQDNTNIIIEFPNEREHSGQPTPSSPNPPAERPGPPDAQSDTNERPRPPRLH